MMLFEPFLGMCEVFASVLDTHDIRATRVPDEVLDDCDWVDHPRMTFYHDVTKDARKAKETFHAFNIGYEDITMRGTLQLPIDMINYRYCSICPIATPLG